MNAPLPVSESAARRVRKAKSRKPVGRSKNGASAQAEPHRAAAGSLTRTKALLLAALRVWELKRKIRD